MFLLIKFTLLYAVVLMLVAMGGMFSERSGVINIALEGIMAIGGLAGVFVLVLFPDLPAPALVALSILASAVSGMIYSLLLGFSAITLKADQTIGGTALNMLATAIAIVLVKAFNNGSDAGNGAASAKLNYTNAAFIYKIGPFTVNIFLFIGIILLICSYVFLFKTKWGLRLRACGEHPQAADSVGINVYQWRYTGVIISGALGGIGGFAYIVPSVTTWNFEVGVAGAGFLALAVMIFGQWKPFHIAGAAVFFAVFRSLANIKGLRQIARFYIWIFRGTPLLVQLFVVFYGLPRAGILIDPFPAAVLVFSLNEGAYSAETMRAALEAVPAGQLEAGYCVGMSYLQIMRRIILPQAMRTAFPPLSNSLIAMVKDTSLS